MVNWYHGMFGQPDDDETLRMLRPNKTEIKYTFATEDGNSSEDTTTSNDEISTPSYVSPTSSEGSSSSWEVVEEK